MHYRSSPISRWRPHAVYSDCAAVVGAAADWAAASWASSLLGGFYRHIRLAAGFSCIMAVRRVKAHQDLSGFGGLALVLAPDVGLDAPWALVGGIAAVATVVVVLAALANQWLAGRRTYGEVLRGS